jgi:putative transcriptional regulator
MTIIPVNMQCITVIMTSKLDIYWALTYDDDKEEDAMQKFRLRNRLKVARAEKNLSQEQLGSLAGVTRQTISSIEKGEYNPSALLAFLLARSLEKPVDALFFLEEEKP